MNWNAVIAVAEIMGVIAVIASLIYVAAQIKQNTAIARATIVHETSVFYSQFFQLLAGDAELADIYHRGREGEELSRSEAQRFEALIEMYMVILEDLDHQYRSDLYYDEEDDIDLIEFMAPLITPLLTSPIGRDWWARVALHSTTPSLYAKISRIVASSDLKSR